jgi:hypothetical protein
MIKVIKAKDGFTVWKANKTKNIYQYFLRPDCSQGKLISKITFKNTTKKPTGFNKNGYGFSGANKTLFYLLKEYFTKVDEITITKNESNIKGKVINFQVAEFEKLTSTLTTTYRENASKIKTVTFLEMCKIFPKKFKSIDKPLTYAQGTIAKILSEKGVASQLSADDISKMVSVFPTIMERSATARVGILSQIRFTELRNKSTKLELKSIIDEYDRLLKKSKQKEEEWQVFLKKNILFFNSSYVNLLDKKNIGLDITIPDFLLIDQFQFVDVFEIKRPDFKCLVYDSSHHNYYWSTEANQAIAQTEKYIYTLETFANDLIVNIRRKGIDINIIRPRGYVLIGKRSSLDAEGQNSFKILNNSLKNVQVIFFDDFLNTLKSKYTIINKK